MWVVPGRNGMCVLSDSGGTCGSVEQAQQGYMVSASTTGEAGAVVADGLVPDGVSSVVAGLQDGTTHEVSVHDNVFSVEVSGQQLRYVSWTDSDGRTVKRALPLPAVQP